MPKPRAQYGPPPLAPASTCTTTTTTTLPSKPAATPTVISNVWALICLYVWLECKEGKVSKTEEIERICLDLAERHVKMFIEGRGVYDHPACTTMRNDYAFSAEEVLKTPIGKAIQKKGQLVERHIKNELIPVLFKSSILDPSNYTIASGKNAGDLLLDVKKRLWEVNGKKSEAFEDDKRLNAYHASFFPFLVTSPLSDYVYERPCHPLFNPCDKRRRGHPAATEATSARKKRGRDAQREKGHGKKPRDSPLDDFPGSASAMAFADADHRKTTSEILMFLIEKGKPGHREAHIAQLEELVAPKMKKTAEMNLSEDEQVEYENESGDAEEEDRDQ